MNGSARRSLQLLGSKVVENLGWRDMWTMVTKKGVQMYGESYNKSSSTHTWGVPVYLKTFVPLVSLQGKNYLKFLSFLPHSRRVIYKLIDRFSH